MGSTLSDKDLNAVVENVALKLRHLADRYGLPVSAQIERWRWDIPSVSLCWTLEDHVARSILAFVKSAEPLLEVEINACKDEGGFRLWRHQVVNAIAVKSVDKEFEPLADRAFKTVSEWRSESLEAKAPLPASALALASPLKPA